MAQSQTASVPHLGPDQVLAFLLLDIVIILVAARVMGRVAARFRQPRVVGEIVAGILLGPTLLGRTVFAWDRPWGFLHCDAALGAGGEPSITSCLFPPQAVSALGLLGQIALVLFMFLVGLELDWTLLEGRGRSIAAVAVGTVAFPVLLGFVIGPLLYDSDFVGGFGTPIGPDRVSFTLFVAAMLTVTAFPILARILQEKGFTATPMGSIAIASAAVVTVLMFLMLTVAAGAASDQSPSSLGVTLVLTAALVAGLLFVVRPALAPAGRAYEAGSGLTPGLFASIFILLFASSYLAHQLGINVIVGSFLVGAILPARQALFRDLAGRMTDLTVVVLLPLFLAFSGLHTDFTTLRLAHAPGIALFLAAGVAGKWLGGMLSARAGGLSWAEGNIIGILMNCRGLLVLVVALIALEEGVISPPLQAAAVLMALVTTMLTGPLFDAFIGRVGAPPAPEAPLAGSATPAFRVLAGTDDLVVAPELAAAAFAVVGGRRPAEVVLCHPIPLSARHVVPGLADEAIESERSLRALRGVAALAPAGVEVLPLAFSSTDPAGDVLRIADQRHCAALVVPWWPGGAPPGPERRVGSGAVRARLGPGDTRAVVAFRPGGDGGPAPGGPVTVVVPAGGYPVAEALGRHLASRSGRPLQQLPLHDDATWVSEASRSSALVLTGPDGRPPGDSNIEALLDGIRCPAYVVTGLAAVDPQLRATGATRSVER